MKQARRIIVVAMLIISFALTTFPAYAADELLGTVIDGSVLTDDDSAEGIAYPKMRGNLLSYGTGGVSIAGSRIVRLSGTTAAYKSVGRIQVTMYLQRLKDGNWTHVLSLGPRIKYNTNIVTSSNTYSVTGGYYYRARGAHTVIDSGTTESVTSYSNGIWVS